MATLERAIAIAADAHAGTVDKAGAPNILHPLRVMLQVESDDERIVAVLHDVIEDTMWTFESLREEGFSEKVLAALDAVTRRPDESYDDYVDRAGANSIGRQVKLADLHDNADISRIVNPTERDLARTEKYHRAIARLGHTLNETS